MNHLIEKNIFRCLLFFKSAFVRHRSSSTAAIERKKNGSLHRASPFNATKTYIPARCRQNNPANAFPVFSKHQFAHQADPLDALPAAAAASTRPTDECERGQARGRPAGDYGPRGASERVPRPMEQLHGDGMSYKQRRRFHRTAAVRRYLQTKRKAFFLDGPGMVQKPEIVLLRKYLRKLQMYVKCSKFQGLF